jgi:TRAP-type C4-dicarboxylate transport system permease small subunit
LRVLSLKRYNIPGVFVSRSFLSQWKDARAGGEALSEPGFLALAHLGGAKLRLYKALKWTGGNFESAFGAILIFAMAFFAFVNVISRYVVNLSLNFTEELNVYFFVWLAFLGSALASREGSHMSISMIYDRFPRPCRAVLYVMAQGVAAALFAALGYCGVLEVMDEIAMKATTETMTVPVWWFTGSIPIGSALILLRTFIKTVKDLKSGNY